MGEKTIRVCDDCGANLEKVSFTSICGLDICIKCERMVVEAHYSKSAKKCKGHGYIRDHVPYGERSSCEKCSGSGTIELSCGLTNKCECDGIL